MNCTEFNKEFEQSLETSQPLDSTAREHLSVCPSCRAFCEYQQQLDDAIDAWRSGSGLEALYELPPQHMEGLVDMLRRAAPPTRLADFVLHQLGELEPAEAGASELPRPLRRVAAVHTHRRESRSAPGFFASRAILFASTVAAVCLVVTVLVSIGRKEQIQQVASQSPAVPVEFTSPSPVIVAAPQDGLVTADVSETLTAVLSDIRSEYQVLATETTLAAREFASVMPVRPISLNLRKPEPETLESVDSKSSAVDATRILSPISTRVESALGFLWNTVPSSVPAG
ncbi:MULTISPECIES: hypothetical protein [unclassified Schlesneria]|uniref:hypothetical protein n=1 Tax=Schlesneria TaxID=656899 RepID=UPI00359F9F25